MTDDPTHTTREAARKRAAQWKDDPEAQKPKDENDRSNEADVFTGEEGED